MDPYSKRLQQTSTAIASSWRQALREPRYLIGFSRLATSSFAALAVWLDPTRPAHDRDVVAMILAGYLLVSLGAIMAAVAKRLTDPVLRLLHGLDLTVLGLLAYFSEELDSPFLIFFTFTIMTSALLWKARGVLLTAAALQTILLVVGWPDLEDGESELNILIIRTCYTWVTAAMLGYFATYRETMRVKMDKLARWRPAAAPVEGGSTLARSLSCALEVLESKAIIVIWTGPDAPRGAGLLCSASDCRALDRLPGEAARRLARHAGCRRVNSDEKHAASIDALLAHADSDEAMGAIGRWQSAFVEGFRNRRQRGTIIILDPEATEETGSLAALVTARVSEQLDQVAAAKEQADAATLQERAALARDLHDSVLQDLAAAALHLKVATTIGNQVSIDTASTILRRQQRAIRRFVEHSRPSAASADQALRSRLLAVATALEKQWDCRIEIEIAPPTLIVASDLVTEICLMLSEAVSNAVRHGGASAITVVVRENAAGLFVSFDDNGASAGGARPRLVESPRSLGARVEQLGGVLKCFQSHRGYTVSSLLPLAAAGDA